MAHGGDLEAKLDPFTMLALHWLSVPRSEAFAQECARREAGPCILQQWACRQP